MVYLTATRYKAAVLPAVALMVLVSSLTSMGYRSGAAQPLSGSISVHVTDEILTIDDFDKTRFGEFAKEGLRRYFRLAPEFDVVARSSGRNSVQDLEVIGPSKCLARSIASNGWQKFRVEVAYGIDDEYLSRTSRIRFEIQLRIVSGEVADFHLAQRPPDDRFKQMSSSTLTDLARRIAGFLNNEMKRQCFERSSLTYCKDKVQDQCP